MAAKKLAGAREHTGVRGLDAMQERIRLLEEVVNNYPFIGGVRRSVQFAGGTPKVVDHGLGVRAACIVIRPSYGGSSLVPFVQEDLAQSGVNLKTSLMLVSNAACVLDLWFYPAISELKPR